MKLYILQAVNEWDPWYDTAMAFVVRAKSPKAARELASRDAGEEGSGVWLDSTLTSCRCLSERGVAKVLIRDYRAA